MFFVCKSNLNKRCSSMWCHSWVTRRKVWREMSLTVKNRVFVTMPYTFFVVTDVEHSASHNKDIPEWIEISPHLARWNWKCFVSLTIFSISCIHVVVRCCVCQRFLLFVIGWWRAILNLAHHSSLCLLSLPVLFSCMIWDGVRIREKRKVTGWYSLVNRDFL